MIPLQCGPEKLHIGGTVQDKMKCFSSESLYIKHGKVSVCTSVTVGVASSEQMTS